MNLQEEKNLPPDVGPSRANFEADPGSGAAAARQEHDNSFDEKRVTESGEQRAVEQVLRDVQAELFDSKQRFAALVMATSNVMYSLNADWSELRRLEGGSFLADTLQSNPNWFEEYIPEQDRALVRAEIQRAVDTKSLYQIEHRVQQLDGSVGWALSRAVPLLDAEGNITEWFGAASDITSRKNAEEALQALTSKLEEQVGVRTRERDRLWELSQDPFMISDLQGRWLSVNPVWTQLLGWSEEELIGRTSEWMEHPEDRYKTRDEVRDLASGRTTLRFVNRFRTKNDDYRWFSWTAIAADDLLYCVAHDITEERAREETRERLEEQLRQSQKLDAIGQLTGGVAHDFNNLMTVIRSSTELLKRPDLTEERRARYVGAISNTVDRAAKLTGQLLAFARRQALNPEVLSACDSVRSLMAMVDTLIGAQIEIVAELPEQTCFVNVDANQFDTALVNMALNARDAMGGKGRLTIRVEPIDEIPAVRAHLAQPGAFVAISLRDTGSGIPAQQLEQIFEPFFTTKAVGQGTGLGLSQVFGFTKQSGGELRVESELGQGSVFTMYLPRSEAVAHTQKAAEPEPLIDGHGTCVLVVEDNVDVGAFAVQTLGDLGYVTVLAGSAEEALAELVKDADRFDVVFSDVVMPGMNGIELAHEIRRLYHDLPVLLASGYSHVMAQNGTSGFELLQKPYSVEQLSRLLRQVATWQRRKRILASSQVRDL